MKTKSIYRLAYGLFVAVLLTSSIVSNTFAKYVTSNTANDTARVAKWGVVIEHSGSLFSNAYLEQANGNTPTVWSSDYKNNGKTITVSTATSSEENIIAPGTKSSDEGLKFKISGKPEVATKIEFTADEDNEDIFLNHGSYGYMNTVLTHEDYSSLPSEEIDSKIQKLINLANSGKDIYESYDTFFYAPITEVSEYNFRNALNNESDLFTFDELFKYSNDYDFSPYCPIKYKFNNESCKNVSELKTKVENYLNGSNYGIYPANTNLESIGSNSGNINITWSWDYSSSNGNNDVFDTFLGDLIAKDSIESNFVYGFETVYYNTSYENGKLSYEYASGQYAPIANTKTHFGFTITVSQVD